MLGVVSLRESLSNRTRRACRGLCSDAGFACAIRRASTLPIVSSVSKIFERVRGEEHNLRQVDLGYGALPNSCSVRSGRSASWGSESVHHRAPRSTEIVEGIGVGDARRFCVAQIRWAARCADESPSPASPRKADPKNSALSAVHFGAVLQRASPARWDFGVGGSRQRCHRNRRFRPAPR